jgi:hypothetical protein
VTGYELDVSRIVREIADELELEGTSREITSGVWSLGRRTLSPAVTVAVFLATRQPSDTSAHSARAVANGARPVLLVPLGRASDGDVPQIECRIPHGPYQGLLGRIVERLNLQDQVSPAVYRIEDLLLDPKRGEAWYLGVRLTKLLAGKHPYRFAEKVAGAGGQLVTKNALREHLSPANQDDSLVRKAKSDFVRLVRESFEEAGKECPSTVTEIFKAQSGDGYVLKATAYIIP